MSGDLAAVLGTQETPGLEFKQSPKNTKAILEAICAFANDLPRLGGGDLLVGVNKAGEALDDVDTSDGTLLALTDMRDNGKIIDRPSMIVQVGTYRGKSIIHIRVDASSTPPVRLDGKVHVRPGRSYSAGVRAGGSHAPVVKSSRRASSLSRPHLVAVSR